MDYMLPFTDQIEDTQEYCKKVAREIASPHAQKEKKDAREISANIQKLLEKTQKEVRNQPEHSKVQCEECHEWFENEEKMTWHSLNWLSSNDH